MSRFSIPRVAVVLFAMALPGAAIAQVPVAPDTAQPDTAHPDTAHPDTSGTMSKPMAAKIEQHITQLHDELQITPAEQPQWDGFAQIMRDNAAKMDRVATRRGNRIAGMNASDSMQSYAELAQVHATNMQKLASGFQPLYASFPDAQKQVADTVFRNNGGHVLPHHH